MSGKPKLAVVKKFAHEAEFEALLRQTAEFMKVRHPQIVRKTASTRRVAIS